MPKASLRPEMIDFLKRPTDASSTDPIERMLAAIRVHLGMDVAFASEFAGGRRIFRHVSAGRRTPVVVGGSDPLEDSYCQRVVDGRLPELIQDAALVPEAAALPVTAALPVGAHLSVPLRLSDGRVYGTFCCFSSHADSTLNERDLAMLKAFADLAADLIEARIGEEVARDSSIRRVRQVISGHSITVVYQPIYSLKNGAAEGVEALARFPDWEHRQPADWFAEAHRAGVGVELELAAARAALAGIPYLPRDLYIAVNFSPDTILSGGVATVLDEAPAGRLVVEVTEHEAIDDYRAFVRALEPLRSRARLAVDDVGAGYAGMRHILDLGPDLIKLDMSLVRSIDRDPARRALALALVAFASGIDSEIVAEGIENGAELAALRELGVAKAQGYHLSRPLPLMAVQQFLNGSADEEPAPYPLQRRRSHRRT